MAAWSCQVRTSYLQSSNVPTNASHTVMYIMTHLFIIPLCQNWNKVTKNKKNCTYKTTKQVPGIHNRPHYIILLETENDAHISLICIINFWMDTTNIQCFISRLNNKQQDWKSEPLIPCSKTIWSKDNTNAFCRHSATVSWLDIKITAIIYTTALTLKCLTQAVDQTFHKNLVCSKLQLVLCPQTLKSEDPDQIFP